MKPTNDNIYFSKKDKALVRSIEVLHMYPADSLMCKCGHKSDSHIHPAIEWGILNLGIGIYNIIMNNAAWSIAISFSISTLMFCQWFQEFPRNYVQPKPKNEEDLYK